jgi:release factor glutamine methyltransferase
VTIAEALRKYTSILKQHDIDEAGNEARVLLCHALNLNAAQLFSQVDMVLTTSEIDSFTSLVERRLKREPTAYITGHKEFFGLDLYVDERVLIPRPETEILVEEAVKFARDWIRRNRCMIRVADVGTGSGAVAIALAACVPDADVYAMDVSESALETARRNVDRYRLSNRIKLLENSLLQQTEGKFDLVVANLPYIAEPEIRSLPEEIRDNEPHLALNGGHGGTELIKELIVQASSRISPGGAVLLEIGASQDREIREFAATVLRETEVTLKRDLAGIDRVMKIVPREGGRRQLITTFVKYLVVGLPNAVIYFGSLYLLTSVLGLWYILSVCIAVALQTVTSFLLNRAWTWRRKKAEFSSAITLYRGIKYTAVSAAGFLLGLLLIYLMTEYLHFWYMLSTLVSSSLLQGLTFLANNYWTWGNDEGKELHGIAGWLRQRRLATMMEKMGVRVT